MEFGSQSAAQWGQLPDRVSYLRATADLLCRVIPNDLVGWNAVDLARGQAEIYAYPEHAITASAGEDLLGVADDHPMMVSYLAEPHPVAIPAPRRLSDLSSDRNLRRTRAFQELLRPLGARRQLTIMVGPVSSHGGHCWALNRQGGDFTDAEVETAAHLQHILALLDRAYSQPPDQVAAFTANALAFGLSARESQVLAAVAQGFNAREVGRLLGISPRTVAKHMENAYAKMGCNNRIAAIARLSTSPESRAATAY